jgi:cobalt/nickel transport system permease protein
MILAILLGPYSAFLVTASVLSVQALFFADGGLLALGCNIFNLGFFPAFIAYPLIYKKIVGGQPNQTKIMIGAILASIAGLQMGAFSVVLETLCSGISSLPFFTFVTIMQPIHLGIGIVEGVVTASVITFVYKARPEIVTGAALSSAGGTVPMRTVVMTFFVAALLTGGFISWFASQNPDGLEWSIQKVTGKEELEADKGGVNGTLAALQEKSTFLQDYNFKKPGNKNGELRVSGTAEKETKKTGADSKTEGEGGKLGTSVAGLIGSFITLALAGIIGLVLKKSAHDVTP